MRVLVACSTRAVVKMILLGGLRLELGTLFMAVAARHGQVSAGKHKLSFLVLTQRKRRWPETLEGMALIAAIQVWSRGELGLMLILVAVKTARKPDFVLGLFSFRNVTLRALHGCVLVF